MNLVIYWFNQITFFKIAPNIPKMFIIVNAIPIIRILSSADLLFKIFLSKNSKANATKEHMQIRNMIPAIDNCCTTY